MISNEKENERKRTEGRHGCLAGEEKLQEDKERVEKNEETTRTATKTAGKRRYLLSFRISFFLFQLLLDAGVDVYPREKFFFFFGSSFLPLIEGSAPPTTWKAIHTHTCV